MKEYLQVLEEDEDVSPTANSIIPTPRTTESPVASPTKRLFERTFSHVEISVASSSLKRKDPYVSFEHIGSSSKRIRQDYDEKEEEQEEEEEEAYASNEESQAVKNRKRWKGKAKELDIDAGPSRLTPEHSTLRRKPLKSSNSRVFVEIPILTSSKKGRTSRDKVRSNWIASSSKHRGSNLVRPTSFSETCHVLNFVSRPRFPRPQSDNLGISPRQYLPPLLAALWRSMRMTTMTNTLWNQILPYTSNPITIVGQILLAVILALAPRK